MGVCAIASSVALVGWFERENWGGPLLVDGSRERKELLWEALTGNWLAGGRVEFRQRGIVYSGRLYPWADIDSYEWEAEPFAPLSLFSKPLSGDTLKLRIKRKLQFLPPVRIRIAPEKIEDVDRVLARYVSEWPH